MAYQIDPQKCETCGACVEACPNEAIKIKGLTAVIDAGLCIDCGNCETTCNSGAISAS
ncbi:MAG: 4Fe-4S binding protein [Verrucomicrobia bacterium]|nr:4Fe-4S binding protein [Verrucomicrobiota bacterium]